MKFALQTCHVGMSILIGGCVVYPSDLAEPEPFKDENLEFVGVGSNKGEVREVLGNNFESFNDGQYWVFVADRAMTKWNVVIPIPQAPQPRPRNRVVRQYSLIFQFDQNDIVQQIMKLNDRNPCNDDNTVCHSGDVLHVLNDAGQAWDRNPAECRLSLYLENSVDHAEFKWILIDKRALPIMLSKAYYSRYYVEAGPHTISLRDLRQDFECHAGQSIFVRFQLSDTRGYSMNAVEPKIAHKDLLNRRHSLFPDSQAKKVGSPN